MVLEYSELYNHYPIKQFLLSISLQPLATLTFFCLYGSAFAYSGYFTYEWYHTTQGFLCWLLLWVIMF